jgi:hypothetical protein
MELALDQRARIMLRITCAANGGIGLVYYTDALWAGRWICRVTPRHTPRLSDADPSTSR